jgi:CheY-like chemotaxis protein
MDVACDKCGGNFKIPDEKVPQGQVFSLTCPKCKNKISVDARSPKGAAPKSDSGPKTPEKRTLVDEVDSGSYDAEEKPFDFLEEGAETALLCEPEPDIRAKLNGALKELGYQVGEPKSPIDALKQMRFHIFDVIVINEMFGTSDPDENNVLRFLDRLGMGTRRDIFVTLVTDRFRTNDNMAAFHKSVNLTVNKKNINDFKTILKRAVADNVAFYRVFREALIKTGRA